jgi:RHH-type rel operon transcriptional repressor/antitoxin RelB
MIRSVSIRLPQEIDERLDALAAKTGRTKTSYISEAVLQHLEDMEDLYDAEQEYREVLAGRSKVHSLNEAEKSPL